MQDLLDIVCTEAHEGVPQNIDRASPEELAEAADEELQRDDGPRIIGGHHENCDVFQLAPDGGPSQKPCNCRPILAKPECTGVSAVWCPVHGDCTCKRDSGQWLNDQECPLHSIDSTHGEGGAG